MSLDSRPYILFGEHSTQAPAIARFVDADRFSVSFAPLAGADWHRYALAVPLSVEQIGAARVANADGVRRAVLPDEALVALCDDKLAFNCRLIALGFGDAVPELLDDRPSTYPYIRKARRGDFGAGCRIVHRPGEEDDAAIPESFCQRAIAGADEYVLHLLRIDGRIRFTLAYRYDMGVPLSVRGAAGRARSVTPADPAPALATCSAILDALGFEGTCCFNYKLEGGALRILELNPRFGGSLVGEVTAYLDAHLAAI